MIKNRHLVVFLFFLLVWLGYAKTNLGGLDRVCGLKGEPYEERFHAIKALANGEIEHQKDEVLRFLGDVEKGGALSDSESAALKNNLIDRITGNPTYTSQLPVLFLRILRDPEQNPVWKDYVIQKIPRVYADCDSGQKQELLTEIRSSTQEKRGVICGTALLSLLRIARVEEEIDLNQVGKLALQIALDSNYGTGSRLTALSVANECGNPSISIVSRSFLKGVEPVVLQVVAISILSGEATEENQSLIEPYRNHSDYRLRKAASAALGKMKPSLP